MKINYQEEQKHHVSINYRKNVSHLRITLRDISV